MIINQKKRNAYDYVAFTMYNDWLVICAKGKPHVREQWEMRANSIMDDMPFYVQRRLRNMMGNEALPSTRENLARSVN